MVISKKWQCDCPHKVYSGKVNFVLHIMRKMGHPCPFIELVTKCIFPVFRYFSTPDAPAPGGSPIPKQDSDAEFSSDENQASSDDDDSSGFSD